MSEQFKICKSEQIVISGLRFDSWNGEIKCGLEKFIPKDALFCETDGAHIFFKESCIGSDPHPFPYLCEAARYLEGGWIVGIDYVKNQYFTPLFT
ncbi:MAG: hypothetical protein IKJ06_04290 [Clostridia bacterium]|nr:hypothetical protein [Clostridia bacterium]